MAGETLETVKNIATGLDSSSLSSSAIFSNPIFIKLAFYGRVAFYILIFVIGGTLIWQHFFSYNIKVTVKKNIGSGAVENVYDRAKLVKDKQGKKKLQLMKTRAGKNKVTVPFPSSKYKGKSGRNDYYEFWLDDKFQLHPIELDKTNLEDIRLRIRPEEREAWARMEDKALFEKYKKKDFLEKYMPSIIVMSAFLIAFLIFFFMSKDLAGSLDNLAGQFAQVASACSNLGG